MTIFSGFQKHYYYVIVSEEGKIECGDMIDPIQTGWVNNKNVILLSDCIGGTL